MSHNKFLISDTHFGHENVIHFTACDGMPMRPFADVREADEEMISRWNSVVRPQDYVYHLGDVAMAQQALHRVLPRLNGHKRLVMGNHDIYHHKVYLQYFEKIFGIKVLEGLILTHIPLHPRSVGSRFYGNVHGHLHANSSRTPWTDYLGDRYYNVSVECIDFTPVELSTVRDALIRRKEASEFLKRNDSDREDDALPDPPPAPPPGGVRVLGGGEDFYF